MGGERDRVTVHLADDHTMFREGLAAILSSREGLEVVGQSSTGEEAEAMIRRSRPDVIVTELDMQLKTAQEVLAGIRSASPGSKIVVLTMFDNLRYMRAVSEMGIDALMHKSSSAEELVEVVDALSRNPDGGNAVVSMPRSLLRRLEAEPVGGLSERETEILVLVARGLSNAQIAKELHLAEATVKRHLANIYGKVGVGSRSEVVRKALLEQWIGVHEIAAAGGPGSADDPDSR
jgi:DNA-binding NarL/FixJ family response regulator